MMTIVKDPIIVKVTFEGTVICTEGKFWRTFAIDSNEYFDEDCSIELSTEFLKAAGLQKSMYRVEKIECSYDDMTWEIKV